MPGADLPDFENGVEATDAPVGRGEQAARQSRRRRPPATGGGNPLLLQSHSGVDPDELCASQEHALSSYLKLHPALSLESTNYQTLQLVANLVEQTSIATKELEIVPKSHDDEFLRCKTAPTPRLRPPHAGLGVCREATLCRFHTYRPFARRAARARVGRPTWTSASGRAALATGACACGWRDGATATPRTWPSWAPSSCARRRRTSSSAAGTCRPPRASASCAAAT